jgi:hypothetical protein
MQEFNLSLFIIFSAAISGFIYALINAIRFSRRESNSEIYRFDDNGMSSYQSEDFSGNYHDNMSSDCGDIGGDGGCDG